MEDFHPVCRDCNLPIYYGQRMEVITDENGNISAYCHGVEEDCSTNINKKWYKGGERE